MMVSCVRYRLQIMMDVMDLSQNVREEDRLITIHIQVRGKTKRLMKEQVINRSHSSLSSVARAALDNYLEVEEE